MRHSLFHEEDFFGQAGANIYASFAPWMAGRPGHPSGMLPIAITANQGTAPTAGSSPAGSTVSVTTGGITINLLFDAADHAMQTLGAQAWDEQEGMIDLFLDARAARSAPISQELALNFIAQHVLGLPSHR